MIPFVSASLKACSIFSLITEYSISSASGTGRLYADSFSAIEDGQLSPAIAHSDLADALPSAHHVRPTAGAGIDGRSDTWRTRYLPEDLSQRAGDYGGEVAADDGTNTPVRGILCVWDDKNNTWRPQNNPDTGSF